MLKALKLAIVAALVFVAAPSFAQETLPPPPPPGGGTVGGGAGGTSGAGGAVGGGGTVVVGEKSNGFGAAHVLAISSDASLSFQYSSRSPNAGSETTFVLRPAADFFVVDNLSVGGFVLLSTQSTSSGNPNVNTPSSTTFGIGPRVGYNIGFTPKLSFWPKGGFSFNSTSFGGASDSRFAIYVFAPFLFHPAEHFFVGLGPDLNVDLSGDVKTTNVGIDLTVGGWVGL